LVLLISGVVVGINLSKRRNVVSSPSPLGLGLATRVHKIISFCAQPGNDRKSFESLLDDSLISKLQQMNNDLVTVLGDRNSINITMCNPRSLATLQMTTLSDASGDSKDLDLPLFGLWMFYFSTDGPNWEINTNWASSEYDRCQWYGIMCSSDNQVERITLTQNRLKGTLPQELFLVTSLTSLDLNSNNLWGTVPPEIQYLASMRQLVLANNVLSGSCPPSIWALTNLEVLNIENNDLTGHIDEDSGIFDLTKLEVLSLLGLNMKGSIPTQIGYLSRLSSLDVSLNFFESTLPTEIGLLSYLRLLNLSGVGLMGKVPTQIGHLTQLQVFWINDNLLSGQIPSEIGLLSKLRDLGLAKNQFSGSIPFEFSRLSEIDYLDMSDIPKLSGSLDGFCKNVTVSPTDTAVQLGGTPIRCPCCFEG